VSVNRSIVLLVGSVLVIAACTVDRGVHGSDRAIKRDDTVNDPGPRHDDHSDANDRRGK